MTGMVNMATGSFGTQFDVMAKAAQQVRQTSDEINGELNSLQSQLEPIAGSWQGSAASAFQQLMERWHTDAQKLTQALTGISEVLDQSNKSYTSTEESNHSEIAKILGGLG